MRPSLEDFPPASPADGLPPSQQADRSGGIRGTPNRADCPQSFPNPISKERYAFVTVVGTVHGGELIRIDAKAPDWLKDRYKHSTKRYGHLDSLEMMIEVEKVIEVREVDGNSMGSRRR
jgi:hypothetical protein